MKKNNSDFCKTCRFCVERQVEVVNSMSGKRRPAMFCHREPPKNVANALGVVQVIWPEVTAEDWCGQFEFDLSS